MTEELQRTQPPVAMIPSHSLSDIQNMAKVIVSSGLFAVRSEPAATVLLLLCQAEGVHPIQAIREFDIVDGRPALKADAMLARFMSRGGRVKWIETTHERVTAEFTAPWDKSPTTVSWSIDDAKRAGLLGKKNWVGYTRQMLRARVISEGIRMTLPAVIVGIYTPEEVSDFDAKPTTPMVAPEKAPEEVPAAKEEKALVPVAPSVKKPLSQEQAGNIRMLLEEAKGKGEGYKAEWSKCLSDILKRSVKSTKDIFDEEYKSLSEALVRITEEAAMEYSEAVESELYE